MTGTYCQVCKRRKILTKLFGDHFCFCCFKNTSNNIHVSLSETIHIRESLKLKGKSSLFRKFKFLMTTGWQPSKKTKDGVNLFRSLDKEKDLYIEIVKDYKTGKIIHKTEEKLSEHIGHGSAKIS